MADSDRDPNAAKLQDGQISFEGGMNWIDAPNELQPNESRFLLNVDVRRKDLEKAKGQRPFSEVEIGAEFYDRFFSTVIDGSKWNGVTDTVDQTITINTEFEAEIKDTVAFSPLNFTGLTMWFDAQDASTITKDGADLVSQWDDKSGNGNDATQGVAGDQPLFQATGLNGLPTLTSVSNDYLDTNFVLPSVTGSAFAVWQAPGAFPDEHGPYGTLRNDERFYIYINNTPSFVFGSGNGGTTVGTPVVNQLYVTSQTMASGIDNVWVNGVQLVTNDAYTETAPTQNFFLLALNVNGSDERHLDSGLSEFILFNRVVSDVERVMIEEYLSVKWGNIF